MPRKRGPRSSAGAAMSGARRHSRCPAAGMEEPTQQAGGQPADAHQIQGWEGAVGGLEGVSTMAALGEGHQTQLLAFVKDDNKLLHVLGAFTYLHALRGGPRKGEKKKRPQPFLSFLLVYFWFPNRRKRTHA